MSLINDALRRARQPQSQRSLPPTRPEPASTLEPVEPPALSPWATLVPTLLVAALVIGLAGTGGWFLWKAMKQTSPPATAVASAPKSVVSTAPNTHAPPIKPAQVASAALPAAPAPVVVSPAPVLPSATNDPGAIAPTNKVAATPPPPPKWPTLKLQGVFYRPSDACVVINNQTLYLNDLIEGVKVVDITRQGVILALGTQTNVMVLR